MAASDYLGVPNTNIRINIINVSHVHLKQPHVDDVKPVAPLEFFNRGAKI